MFNKRFSAIDFRLKLDNERNVITGALLNSNAEKINAEVKSHEKSNLIVDIVCLVSALLTIAGSFYIPVVTRSFGYDSIVLKNFTGFALVALFTCASIVCVVNYAKISTKQRSVILGSLDALIDMELANSQVPIFYVNALSPSLARYKGKPKSLIHDIYVAAKMDDRMSTLIAQIIEFHKMRLSGENVDVSSLTEIELSIASLLIINQSYVKK